MTGTDFGRARTVLAPAAFFRFAVVLSILTGLSGCDESGESPPQRMVDGDPELGEAAILRYDCGICHAIPGIDGANGTVGPPLTDFAHRVYIAGVAPNQPEFLTRWIQNPPAIAPNTAMPDLGVSDEDARHIAAYLYTLR
ncbi:c-type cytochrome [Virgifigura deserti]|uniref:c-type cytochrome n=1 Tax=Virgifigura deserti TaxID=2268457 RepID=UPI003CCC08BE